MLSIIQKLRIKIGNDFSTFWHVPNHYPAMINVIKDITLNDSKDMTASKLLGLVNSRAVVCQPWEDSNKLAKKTIFSWKNNTLLTVKTMFQLVPSSSPSPACLVLAPEPLELLPKTDLPPPVNHNPVWVPWSNQTYAQICACQWN